MLRSVLHSFPLYSRTLTLLLIAVALLGACRGGEPPEQSDRIDPRRVPTQALPDTLPDPIIVSGPGGRGTPTPAVALETYQVRSGDTLAAIAARFNTTVEELVKLNDLRDPGRLEVGQMLRVPRQGTATPPAAAGLPPGATPGTTVTATPRPGTPTPTPTPAAGGLRTATPTTAAPGGFQTYEVQAGDTAAGIAARFGITLQELAAANNTTVADLNNLRVGQQLRIPRR